MFSGIEDEFKRLDTFAKRAERQTFILTGFGRQSPVSPESSFGESLPKKAAVPKSFPLPEFHELAILVFCSSLLT
jgi:hypothetical protein